METLEYVVQINAPVEKVWREMLDPDTYREWAAEFMEGSYYEGSWEEGETIHFLSRDRGGVFSVIEENRPHEYISMRHLGLVSKGVEDTESPLAKEWASFHERYTFREQEGGTLLQIELDVNDEVKAEMERGWPRALARLKAICEGD